MSRKVQRRAPAPRREGTQVRSPSGPASPLSHSTYISGRIRIRSGIPGAWRECTRLENLQIKTRGNQHPTGLTKVRLGLAPSAPRLLPRRPSPGWGKALGGPRGALHDHWLALCRRAGPTSFSSAAPPLTQCLEQWGLQDAMRGSERTYSQKTHKDLGRAGQAKGKEEAGLTPSR